MFNERTDRIIFDIVTVAFLWEILRGFIFMWGELR